MTAEQIEADIKQLEVQRSQALSQLNAIEGALNYAKALHKKMLEPQAAEEPKVEAAE